MVHIWILKEEYIVFMSAFFFDSMPTSTCDHVYNKTGTFLPDQQNMINSICSGILIWLWSKIQQRKG